MQRYVVVVKLEINEDMFDDFMNILDENAKLSSMEDGCSQFDILANENHILIYEVYNNKEDFESHIRTPHYIEFDRMTREHIKSKIVEVYNLNKSLLK